MAILAMRIVEAMFFAGLAGCALVIVISWISIFRDGIREGKKTD
jgi:hypothetical protein